MGMPWIGKYFAAHAVDYFTDWRTESVASGSATSVTHSIACSAFRIGHSSKVISMRRRSSCLSRIAGCHRSAKREVHPVAMHVPTMRNGPVRCASHRRSDHCVSSDPVRTATAAPAETRTIFACDQIGRAEWVFFIRRRGTTIVILPTPFHSRNYEFPDPRSSAPNLRRAVLLFRSPDHARSTDHPSPHFASSFPQCS